MPIHDWNKVLPGDFHDFHQGWTVAIRTALNRGVLPEGYAAYVERSAARVAPDVLTLHLNDASAESANEPVPGAIAVATSPPKVQTIADLERSIYEFRKNVVAIYHVASKRVVAMIELVSSGNKASSREFTRFLDKATSLIEKKIHLLIIDLYPPTTRDPDGIHAAIWSELGGDAYHPPRNKPLTLVSYCSGTIPRAFVEPIAVGDELPPMPLFLNEDQYVNVPLSQTYNDALEGTADALLIELRKTLP